MKKILIISATNASNLKLAGNMAEIINTQAYNHEVISLEDYNLPLYSGPKESEGTPEGVKELTQKLIDADGLIVCAPEYNGGVPPVITNAIAWISVSTDYWRDAFTDKVALITSSSGGMASKYIIAMKNQLEHLGVVVMPRTITISGSSPLKQDSAEKIIKSLIGIMILIHWLWDILLMMLIL